ncbi:DNA polymerase [Ruminococcus albus]|uniref:DNA-directed DNA polymerase n=1 Tax=Ruminococcus albus TaxID=1264 RepID=A0A1H7MRN0_RUMAL|nr:DNA polymerase [Ruminococcus albus]SEL13863.1 DNA polymerase [Ruminococcus albus]
MGNIRHLSIDLETYSDVDIKKSGAHAYVQRPDFQILLNSYCFWGEMNEPEVLDFSHGSVLPQGFIDALFDPNIIKHAYNATFEYLCFCRALGVELPRDQWRDTMLHSLYCGYPASLDAAGKAIGLSEDKQKLATGKALIRYFCNPCKPTRTNGGRTRNLPQHDPEKWAMFKEYNRQDVVTEMEIERRLSDIPVPDEVQRQWVTDLTINCRGVAVDMPLVDGALDIAARTTERLTDEAVKLTGLDNPNSGKQLTAWLSEHTGTDVDNIRKDTVSSMLKADYSPDVHRMLEIRQELGKTSTKKYDAIRNCVCPDGRVRGLLQFYGANRTGRWAGRLVQVQNLPRTYTDPLPLARELIKNKSLDGLQAVYGSVYDTLSQLIRTAFVSSNCDSKEGNVLIDADFSAIEARVISWLADEKWRLNVFRTHGKIYEASAAQMFGVPIDRIKKGNPEYALRAKGKVAELALGYQGGAGALIAMGALDMGLHEDELPDIVSRWRDSNSRIQQLWWDFNSAAIEVIKGGGMRKVQCCTFALERNRAGTYFMTVQLPSGRKLYYVSPRIGTNRFGGESIIYKGINDKNQFADLETYGGKLVENCVQAIARDCLAVAIDRLEAAGYPIVFHIHDEIIADIKPYTFAEDMLEDVVRIMSSPIPWAPGLPLAADGWVGTFFKKE